ncbi:hypothetical protein [Frankia sp. BMG5.23]|uniref:hypothetical protein n=1 Tax=Frankia sp. BMG5.23 TaxID=683305 RepID=UPI000461FD7B|nr:hypothetical protein [Frankia sp. BMG5.23]KDA44968.1 hypothetical protein BMG523Draft_00093 [Frankia sp. BMG5.23]
MSIWSDQRRADRAADREQARLDLDAAAARRSKARAEADGRAEKRRAERETSRTRRRNIRKARRAELAGWASEHTVELLVYPLAVVCAGMAIPAMAYYGFQLYGGVTGVALPALSELGAWAFALAVLVSRRRTPDRPTRWLTVGIVVFAGVGAALNFAHGATSRGPVAGLVMAVVSVAGVGAHQLAVAAPPRSRAERAASRHARLVARRVERARRLAIRRAVVELAADGGATLVYAPGRYTPHRRRLMPAVVPGLPVDPDDGWDTALADLIEHAPDAAPAGPAGTDLKGEDRQERTNEPDVHDHDGQSDTGSGGVAVLDPPPPGRPAPARAGRPINPKARVRIDDDTAYTTAVTLARTQGRRVTVAALMAALPIGKDRARVLRDRVNADLYGKKS